MPHARFHRPSILLRVLLNIAATSMLMVGGAQALAQKGGTAPTASSQGVQPRTPAPPTRTLTLTDALRDLERTTISSDAQRHQPKGFPCAGFYPKHPAYRLKVTQPETLRIGAKAHNSTDMTIAVALEDGRWLCNDDAREDTHDPEIFETLPAGTHTIYFGSYHRFAALDYTPYIRQDKKPAWARCIDVDVITDPDEVPITLAGEISEEVYKCHWMLGAAQCDWFLPSKANACVDLTEPTALSVRTQNASFDTTLVIQRVIDTAEGPIADDFTLRNDDISPENRHSEIQHELEPGRYLIFVGSYDRLTDGTFDVRIGPIPLEAP